MEDKRFKNIIDMDESLTPQKIADAINNHEYEDF